jgi:hypothetical protein
MPYSEELLDLNGLYFARFEVTTELMCRIQDFRVVIDCRWFERAVAGGGGVPHLSSRFEEP